MLAVILDLADVHAVICIQWVGSFILLVISVKLLLDSMILSRFGSATRALFVAPGSPTLIPGTAALITGTPTLIPGTATLISGTATLITGTATLIPGAATVIPGTRSIGDSYFQVFPRFRSNSC